MTRSEYVANIELAKSATKIVKSATKIVKSAPADYITGPIIRPESEKPAVEMGRLLPLCYKS